MSDLLSTRDQVALHHSRLTGEGLCDRCLQPPADGEQLAVSRVQLPQVSIVFRICKTCVMAETERFQTYSMSHQAAETFLYSQAPQDLGAVASELVDLKARIDKWSAPGEHCDNCNAILIAEDPISTGTLPLSGALTFHTVLVVLCPTCSKTEAPRFRAKCQRFLDRLVSVKTSVFIGDLLTSTAKERVN